MKAKATKPPTVHLLDVGTEEGACQMLDLVLLHSGLNPHQLCYSFLETYISEMEERVQELTTQPLTNKQLKNAERWMQELLALLNRCAKVHTEALQTITARRRKIQ